LLSVLAARGSTGYTYGMIARATIASLSSTSSSSLFSLWYLLSGSPEAAG
jgi:hypothetical protein